MPLFDRIALGLLFVYLASDVLGGALRYYAVQTGLPWLSYLPGILLAASVIPMFLAYVASEGITPTYTIILLIFGVAATYGVFNLGNPDQVAFGLWSLVPFLYGIVVLPAILRAWRGFTPYVLSLWVVAVAGVLINFFYTWPWIGFHYQIGAAELSASRLWSIGGYNVARLPGFSEASYFAAPEILLLALFLMETFRSKWRIPMWIASGAALILTTSKTEILVFLIFSALWICYGSSIRRSWRLIPIVAAIIDIALPFAALTVSADWLQPGSSKLGVALVSSLADRVQNGWPVWIRMIVTHGSVLFGRGLGGIGTAQQHFESALYNPGDNIGIFAYSTFGVLGIALFLFYTWKAAKIPVRDPLGRWFFYCACALSILGVATTVMDGTIVGLVFGASLRYLFGSEGLRFDVPGRERQTGPSLGATYPPPAPL
jgi:hypothetical protein